MPDLDGNLVMGGVAAILLSCYAYRNLDCCGINVHNLCIVNSWRIRNDNNNSPTDKRDILVLKLVNDNNIVWCIVYLNTTSNGTKIDTCKPILFSSNACIAIYNCESTANVCSDSPGKIVINDIQNVCGAIWSKKSDRTKTQMKDAINEMICIVSGFDDNDGLDDCDTNEISALGVDNDTEYYTNAGKVKEYLVDFRNNCFGKDSCNTTCNTPCNTTCNTTC